MLVISIAAIPRYPALSESTFCLVCLLISELISSLTLDTGIEYAIPSTPSDDVLAKLIAITLPLALRSAPPLLPELIAALVIISPENVTLLTVIDLSRALIIPLVTDCPSPSALPIATTCWPTAIVSESASSAIAILLIVSDGISDNDTATTAIS